MPVQYEKKGHIGHIRLDGRGNKAAWYYLATDTRLIRANDTEAHHDDL